MDSRKTVVGRTYYLAWDYSDAVYRDVFHDGWSHPWPLVRSFVSCNRCIYESIHVILASMPEWRD